MVWGAGTSMRTRRWIPALSVGVSVGVSMAEVDMLVVIRRLVIARLGVIGCTGNLNGVGFTFTVYSSIGKLSTSATMF